MFRSYPLIEASPEGDPIPRADRGRVKLYFKTKRPDWLRWVVLYGAGAVACLIFGTAYGLPQSAVATPALFGLVVFGVSAGLELHTWATEQLVDVVAAADFERAQGLLLRRLQLTATDLRAPESCSFLAAHAKDTEYGGAVNKLRLGLDERTRWTPHEIATVYAGPRQLWVHWCAIDLTTGAALFERVREIFYVDIVSVIVENELLTRPLPANSKKAHKASSYWSQRGMVVTDDSMQLPANQTVTLALTSCEQFAIASWPGARDNARPKDVEHNIESARRLQAWVHEAKQRPLPSLRVPRVVRYPKYNA